MFMTVGLVLLSTFAIASRHSSVKRLIIFGDSMSDNGVKGTHDQYGFSRYSTGHVWNEYLAETLHLKLRNYAFGGAKSGYDHQLFSGWAGVAWQVDQYLKDVGGKVPETDLIGYQMGGVNDFIAGERSAHPVAKNNLRNVKRLVNRGARNIFILMIIRADKIPAVSDKGLVATWLARWIISDTNYLFEKSAREFLSNSTNVNYRLIYYDKVFDILEERGIRMEPFVRSNTTKIGDQHKYAYMEDKMHPTDVSHRGLAEFLEEPIRQLIFAGGRRSASFHPADESDDRHHAIESQATKNAPGGAGARAAERLARPFVFMTVLVTRIIYA